MDTEFIDTLLFETQEHAQELIDAEYPGYEIAVAQSGRAVIFDSNGEIVYNIRNTTK